MKKIFLSTIFAVGAMAFAQDNTPPTIKLVLPKSAKAGSVVKGTVKVKFAPGLHGYQNPPTRSYLVPVSVKSDTKGVSLEKARYPKGIMKESLGDTLAVYEGEVSIPVELKITSKGQVKVVLDINYQQCNDNACFNPTSAKVSQTIAVK